MPTENKLLRDMFTFHLQAARFLANQNVCLDQKMILSCATSCPVMIKIAFLAEMSLKCNVNFGCGEYSEYSLYVIHDKFCQ